MGFRHVVILCLVLGSTYGAPVVDSSFTKLIYVGGLISLKCSIENLNWVLVDDYCYYRISDVDEIGTSWSDASDFCSGYGTELMYMSALLDGQPFPEGLIQAELAEQGMSFWIATSDMLNTTSFDSTRNVSSTDLGPLAPALITSQPTTICPYATINSDGMAQFDTADCSTPNISALCVTVPNVAVSMIVKSGSANASEFNVGSSDFVLIA